MTVRCDISAGRCQQLCDRLPTASILFAPAQWIVAVIGRLFLYGLEVSCCLAVVQQWQVGTPELPVAGTVQVNGR